MAVFDREKLVDVIPIDEAKGILWINDEIERALLVVEQERLGILSAEVQDSKTRISMGLIAGIPNFEIKINCNAQLLELISENRTGSISKEEKKLAEHLLEQMIQKETEDAIRRCFLQNRCDVFRFCDYIKRQEPEYWEVVKDHWQELMPDCQVKISVSCTISKTGQQAME